MIVWRIGTITIIRIVSGSRFRWRNSLRVRARSRLMRPVREAGEEALTSCRHGLPRPRLPRERHEHVFQRRVSARDAAERGEEGLDVALAPGPRHGAQADAEEVRVLEA